MDGGAWWVTVRVVAELDTTERLHFHFHFHFHLEWTGWISLLSKGFSRVFNPFQALTQFLHKSAPHPSKTTVLYHTHPQDPGVSAQHHDAYGNIFQVNVMGPLAGTQTSTISSSF